MEGERLRTVSQQLLRGVVEQMALDRRVPAGALLGGGRFGTRVKRWFFVDTFFRISYSSAHLRHLRFRSLRIVHRRAGYDRVVSGAFATIREHVAVPRVVPKGKQITRLGGITFLGAVLFQFNDHLVKSPYVGQPA